MHKKAQYGDKALLGEQIKVAQGLEQADFVFKNVRFLDVFNGEFLFGDVALHKGFIVGVLDEYSGRQEVDCQGRYLVPGFIDSHVHIESSMMTPARFQEAVLPCGTTSVIWDPHEIANVKGAAGIQWALEASEGLLLDFFVMVPSCVPSTSSELKFETSGAELRAADLLPFRDHPRVLGLAEMMNFPGLLSGDQDVLSKIDAFSGKKRDGHCPGLSGKALNAYGVAGIHSCHESTTAEEALEKLRKGMHVLIREGSCAKDAKVLLPLVNAYSSAVLALCSDDRNPLDIAEAGHISCIAAMALQQGVRPEDIFRVASFAAARAYGLEDRGVIAPGYQADLVLLNPRRADDLASGFSIEKVYKRGVCVDREDLRIESERRMGVPFTGRNINLEKVSPKDFLIRGKGEHVEARAIGVIPGQILTESLGVELRCDSDSGVLNDKAADVLKISVCERHHGTGQRTVGFVKGFGLKKGAIATSINHDSHNVIVVGASDEAMAHAVNALIETDGGIVVVGEGEACVSLRLPIGGLMTDAEPEFIAERLRELKALAKKNGCLLDEPFLTLSFLALPVIPALKITDQGLIDVEQFKIVSVLK